eukprot:TRINITY_DN52460_c0_g1_i1.p1 TRINITY_DN52460_c0_g1~~TRINITY_DN52460_c0_g1_i1.p1  ORF type:complete len:278 (+),score=47.24 TRINITY_DN52460_c0_g1_i1:145-978(+)
MCIRDRLQNELVQKGSQQFRMTYPNAPRAFVGILQAEGLRGIQAGLRPAILYQIAMNGTRIGCHSKFKTLLGADQSADSKLVHTFKSWCAGGASGALGAALGNPFYLIKCRLQSASSVNSHVGHQFQYSGLMGGFKSVVSQDGWLGLMRGVNAALPRVAIGSSTQLSSYDLFKQLLGDSLEGVPLHFGASLGSSVITVTMMNPLDVATTRLMNQPTVNGKGQLYEGVIDCLGKTVKAEGASGLMKGWLAQYLRLGPHTILTFIFLEQVKSLAASRGI